MGLVPTLNHPVAGNPRVPTPFYDNDVAIRAVVNGNIDAANLASNAVTTAKITDANVTDAKLASPNNSAYRKIFQATGALGGGSTQQGYWIGQDSGMTASGTARAIPVMSFYFAAADYAVAGLTTKLNLRAQILTNATAPTSTFTFGLYPFTVAGGASTQAITLGTVTSGSTAAIAAPGASGAASATSGDFTIPSDGHYTLAVVVSVANTAANSFSSSQAQLRFRNV